MSTHSSDKDRALPIDERLFNLALELTEEHQKNFWRRVLTDDRSPIKVFVLSLCEAFQNSQEPKPVVNWKEAIQQYEDGFFIVNVENLPEGIGGIGATSPEGLAENMAFVGLGVHKGRVERDIERNPKTRKEERNYLVHYLKTEEKCDWRGIRKRLLAGLSQISGPSSCDIRPVFQGFHHHA